MHALRAYTAFVRAFEAGSFSAVARELGTTQSAVSKQIAMLEEGLGVQLFNRTTRRLQPTAEALALYEHVRQLLDAVEALKAPAGRQVRATGVLRVTIPTSYGRHRVVPLLPKFLEREPQVQVQVFLTDELLDLVGEGFELAIRIGTLPPSTLMARRIGMIEQRLVASAEYLAEHGVPESPADLAEHACLPWGWGAASRWEFESESGRQAVEVTGRAKLSDPDAAYALVLAHQGIALLPDWLLGEELREGRVEALLPDYYPLARPVSVVYPSTRYLSQRARSFLDFVIGELRDGR